MIFYFDDYFPVNSATLIKYLEQFNDNFLVF